MDNVPDMARSGSEPPQTPMTAQDTVLFQDNHPRTEFHAFPEAGHALAALDLGYETCTESPLDIVARLPNPFARGDSDRSGGQP